MKNPYNYLRTRCADAGVSLNEVCRRAGVGRMGIQRWKKNPPAAFQTLAKLEAVLDEITAEKPGE